MVSEGRQGIVTEVPLALGLNLGQGVRSRPGGHCSEDQRWSIGLRSHGHRAGEGDMGLLGSDFD